MSRNEVTDAQWAFTPLAFSQNRARTLPAVFLYTPTNPHCSASTRAEFYSKDGDLLRQDFQGI